MNWNIRGRLGLMMFLEYFIWGGWYVTFTTWLSQTLHLRARRRAWLRGLRRSGRWSRRFLWAWWRTASLLRSSLLAALHVLGGVVLFLASRQTDFTGLYSLVLIYCLCYMPTMALTNSLAFRQMRDPQTEFGPIRVLGTRAGLWPGC